MLEAAITKYSTCDPNTEHLPLHYDGVVQYGAAGVVQYGGAAQYGGAVQ